jgi:broad specificity phosphatase PhoE
VTRARSARAGTARVRRFGASLLPLAAILALVLIRIGPVAGAEPSAWQALRTPGAVVLLRHSTAPGTFDPPDARLDDCATQRNLDASGRAQARRIGEAFRQRGIRVDAVLSSPRCRCLDTARLAFGSAEPWGPLQGAPKDSDQRRRQLAEIRERIEAHQTGAPLVLVTHGSVITGVTGRHVRMGELVVLQRGTDGRHAVAAQLFVD